MRALTCLGLCLIAAFALSACGQQDLQSPTHPELAPESMQSLVAGENASILLDVKPLVSPNKVRHLGHGRLRAAIVGTEEFDVRNVDITTVTLEGVSPRRVSYRDLTSPAARANEFTDYRVNCGGPVVTADGDDWLEDSDGNRSPYVNTGFGAVGTDVIDMSHPSVPAGTPVELFQSERWDWSASPEMLWDFPVSDGDYVVRLYFSENYPPNQAVGSRVFDVAIEGEVVLDDYDIFADVGAFVGVMKEFRTTVDDGELAIEFLRGVSSPKIAAIEILSAAPEQIGKVRSVQDGIEDLVLSFSKKKLRRAIGKLNRGEERTLTIEGQLLDGTPFSATDVILFTGRGKDRR